MTRKNLNDFIFKYGFVLDKLTVIKTQDLREYLEKEIEFNSEIELTPKDKFNEELEKFIDIINKIDKEVIWAPKEPDWWIDMMQLYQQSINIRNKYKFK